MFGRFLLLLIAVPFVDLALLLYLAQYTGAPFAVGLVLVTGLAGVWLARRQWHWLLKRSRSRIEQQELPAELIADGFLILLGGCLLVAPGVLTDIAGLALMLPAGRRWFRNRGAAWVRERLKMAARPLDAFPGSGTVDGSARETPPNGRTGKPAPPLVGRLHQP